MYPLLQIPQILLLTPLEIGIRQLPKEGRRLELVDLNLSYFLSHCHGRGLLVNEELRVLNRIVHAIKLLHFSLQPIQQYSIVCVEYLLKQYAEGTPKAQGKEYVGSKIHNGEPDPSKLLQVSAHQKVRV
jgi:hypothetical protein